MHKFLIGIAVLVAAWHLAGLLLFVTLAVLRLLLPWLILAGVVYLAWQLVARR